MKNKGKTDIRSDIMERTISAIDKKPSLLEQRIHNEKSWKQIFKSGQSLKSKLEAFKFLLTQVGSFC